jgi:hypothetical protein
MNEMQIRAIVAQTGECPPCKFIKEDLDLHGKLTGYPFDAAGAERYPVEGKMKHLDLEKKSLENH